MAICSSLRAPVLARSGAVVASLLLLAACSSPPPAKPRAAKPIAKAPAVSTQPDRQLASKPSQPIVPPPEPNRAADPADVALARGKGWIWMVDKLASDGISRDRAARAFADPRMPAFDAGGLLFGLNPRESHFMYRNFLKAPSVAAAERCAESHAADLVAAQRLHGVDASVVAAIMHVETHCGRNTGNSMVLHRLARLAMANEPRNVARNLARNTGKNGRIDPELAERVRSRARYLEGIFYPQVIATFEIARQQRIDPVAMRGSAAGAFGYVQFLPMNFVAFGTDGDGNGRVSLYEVADAASSCARFLASYGWKPGISREKRRQIIWHYNRSDAYIDTVLGLADRIDASGVLAATRNRPEATEARALPVVVPGRRPASATQYP
jgi:membrane-bound lytic murein transglycosylase B